ncbi:UV damage endonuclease UvdE [Polytolypa hystricis UAMH7299]|uniref:UV damage endonuclease UvdE n=1 Tax=Polytolypa hystricis (strain UAMH7299) TaxID=1447883 RepID=A0A2B7X223_POLH7|nr:UV damage endonuclease UvdE [Polytolypa hystricis UAMH7299]
MSGLNALFYKCKLPTPIRLLLAHNPRCPHLGSGPKVSTRRLTVSRGSSPLTLHNASSPSPPHISRLVIAGFMAKRKRSSIPAATNSTSDPVASGGVLPLQSEPSLPVELPSSTISQDGSRILGDGSCSPLSDVSETPASKGTSTTPAKKSSNGEILDPESDVEVPANEEEVKEAISRPPPVNSPYLPLPWKGRLGYACLCTYLRTSKPPVFSSRTCRIASILENRHPLKDPSQAPHRTKNRPDRDQPADHALGLAFVQQLGLANARDIVKMLHWNDRYGIKFMRLSSDMFPFASHAEYGYTLAPFAAGVLVEAGKVAAELKHRLSVHPGQFTQLGSPRKQVIVSSIRDLEYHSEMLRLLKLPPQQNRDAVMILHMGGTFGDKPATLDRFRENYKTLSQDIKNRLVLENDDVSWTVHDLLPVCEELNIPLVLDYHHHNINFDADKIREGTLDIMNLYDRIKATWTRKGITQKMHYSEPTPAAITKSQRRKHNPRVQMLPPCDPTMDLMIEAKDKEQAVFDLMRTYKLPGFEQINEIVPYVRFDENVTTKRRKTKDSDTDAGNNGKTIPDEEVGMGGPEGRVYWPPGMEHWLRPEKRTTKRNIAAAIAETTQPKSGRRVKAAAVTEPAAIEPEEVSETPKTKQKKTAKGTKSTATKGRRERKAASSPSPSSSSDEQLPSIDSDELAGPEPSEKLATRASRRTKVAPPRPLLPSRLGASASSSFKLRSRLLLRTPPQSQWSLLRYLFPHTHQRARTRFLDFRHETIPYWRQRAHSRIYRAIVDRQQRVKRRRAIGTATATATAAAAGWKNYRRGGLINLLVWVQRGRRAISWGAAGAGLKKKKAKNRTSGLDSGGSSRSIAAAAAPAAGLGSTYTAAAAARAKDAKVGNMTSQPSPWGDNAMDSGYGYEWGAAGRGEEPIRERGTRRRKVFGYLKAANELRQSYSAQWGQRKDLDDEGGGMPGAYPDFEAARYGDEEMVLFPSYGRRHVRRRPEVDYGREGGMDLDHNDPEAVGQWEYWKGEWEKYESDHAVVDIDVRGWLYAPHRGPLNRKNRILISLARRLSGIPAPNTVTAESRVSTPSPGLRDRVAHQDDALVEKQAQSIINKVPGDTDSEFRSEPASSSREFMTQDEITAANAQLMERLRPFLTNPIVSVPLTVFFFNKNQSQSRTVSTNEGGHFSLRAALDFVPTHIRVLAAEHLSATEEVSIIESTGISLISDIDDTIKHSAITSGAKEIFRNTFVRNYADLRVLGVKEWYSKLADMDVRIHYVSNSPWQLYPLLTNFFAFVGLPSGSFHLKQYSGMMQGIFEPTTEKKKPTLERIMLDFPDRRFILVGDSGEADLEAYTDLVLANPGRVLAVFIRDVTTPNHSKFFDKSVAHLERPPRIASVDRLADNPDASQNRPSLPPRRYLDERKEPDSGNPIDLIDLDTEIKESQSVSDSSRSLSAKAAPPVKPSKPAALRVETTESKGNDTKLEAPLVVKRKPVPPLPEKPQRLSSVKGDPPAPAPLRRSQTDFLTPEAGSYSNSPTSSHPSGNEIGYTSATRNKGSGAYNQHTSPLATFTTSADLDSTSRSKQTPPPPPPPRRSTNQVTKSTPGTPSRATPPPLPPGPNQTPTFDSLLSRTPSSFAATPQSSSAPTPQPLYTYSSSSSSSAVPQPLPNKREELWRRRWARAADLLERQGVVLETWKVGEDVQDLCVRIVERAKREMK